MKEKAKELVDRYEFELSTSKEDAKQCALICVDEIMKVLNTEQNNERNEIEIKEDLKYWKEIKQEIKKL